MVYASWNGSGRSRSNSLSTKLEEIGFDSYSETAFRKAITKPYGMIIVTGPTGSGKSTTLHTNDAASAISRMYKMGVEPFLIAYFINIILAQRLVPKLCGRCKTPIKEPDVEALAKLGLTQEEIESLTFCRPVGCISCIKGFKGRTAIYETPPFTKTIQQMILRAGDVVDDEAIRHEALKKGMQTLRMSGLQLVRKGVTTVQEIASVTMEDEE